MASSRRFAVAWLALLCALAMRADVRAQGAEAGRTQARAGVIAGCLREGQADPDLRDSGMPAMCGCYADYVVDRATIADLEDLDSPNATALIERAAKACLNKSHEGGR